MKAISDNGKFCAVTVKASMHTMCIKNEIKIMIIFLCQPSLMAYSQTEYCVWFLSDSSVTFRATQVFGYF